MPIIRTYACPECNHFMDVVLAADEWDAPPPDCPRCRAWDLQEPMRQQFKPVAIGGSHSARAHALAEKIAAEDYGVANMQPQSREGGVPKVRYKDDSGNVGKGGWSGPNAKDYQVGREALEMAMSIGRQTRLQYGSGLDVLRSGLADGSIPDLIENSKRKSHRIW